MHPKNYGIITVLYPFHQHYNPQSTQHNCKKNNRIHQMNQEMCKAYPGWHHNTSWCNTPLYHHYDPQDASCLNTGSSRRNNIFFQGVCSGHNEPLSLNGAILMSLSCCSLYINCWSRTWRTLSTMTKQCNSYIST